MILFKKAGELSNYIRKKQSAGLQVGFVPTMGALHEGHLSLIQASKQDAGLSICSIFVNPTQFNDPKDFQKYPVTIEKDIYILEKNGVDLLFLPSVEEIYPNGTTNIETYPLGYLETVLEGKYRPGHFQGVCQVMHRLLNIVKPDHLFMGQKDYQQCMVIKKLISLMQSKIIFHACATVRETDGLAMSSRNRRLNESERKKALGIYEALTYLKKNLSKGNLSDLIAQAHNILTDQHFKIDYVEIADADSLELIHEWNGKQKLVALIAAFQDEVRLIDNMILTF
ncbi:MAG TPA: pantoate--beta-alanine ligase [Puia sp.]|nr:pantoate--beta-alanine ligase [Puia sp.]